MEIHPSKIAEWKKNNKEFHLLDVRHPQERELASLGGFHIPLQELEDNFNQLPRDHRPIIVYCHHGVRSLYATQFLKYHGFDVLSLAGGIDLWSLEIDPSIPRY
jgi:rhodanese-related sulfurtransferase